MDNRIDSDENVPMELSPEDSAAWTLAAHYGLAVVDVDTNQILHAVLYQESPGAEEMEDLAREMLEDPDLYEEVRDHEFRILRMDPKLVQMVKDEWIGE